MKYLIILTFILLVPASTSYAQPGRYVTKGDHAGCLKKSDIEKVTDYATAKDMEAYKKIVDGKRCVALKEGVEVQLMDSSWGLVKIRPIEHELTI